MKSSGRKLRQMQVATVEINGSHLQRGTLSVEVRAWQHSRVEPKERDQPIHLGNSERCKGVRGSGWGSWKPGGSALTAQEWRLPAAEVLERGPLLPSGGLHQRCAVC